MERKYCGIVRYTDALGRITIPMEFRKELGIDKPNSKVEIYLVEVGNEKVIEITKAED